MWNLRAGCSSLKRVVKIVLINILVFLVLLLALEGVSRLWRPAGLPDPLITDTLSGWAAARVYDPLLFWRVKPNIGGENGCTTNSMGLRGPEIPEKTDREFRILSLGESTTFCARFSYYESYSALLEKGLAQVQGKKVRVINAGSPAYTLLQGYVYLKHYGLELKPDAVLLYFGMNDFIPIAGRMMRDAGAGASTVGLTDRQLLEQRKGLKYQITHFLAEHSSFCSLLLFRDWGVQDEIVSCELIPRVPEKDRLWFLGKYRKLCDAEGIRLVIVIPWYREFDRHGPLLRGFALRKGITLVDLPTLFKSLPKARDDYFEDKAHPTREGHALIAKAIEDELRRAWNLKKGDDSQEERGSSQAVNDLIH